MQETLVFIIMVFVINNPAGYVFAALFLGLMIGLSKVPVKFMLKGLKAVWFYFDIYGSVKSVFNTGRDCMAV